ncbi:MAG: hypothetical protein ACKPKO_19965, partial [Candidatus Fonsibacter sp.]
FDKGKGKGKPKREGQGQTSGSKERSSSVGHIPSSSGVCFMFARSGKCDNDNCTYQHVSSDQLKKVMTAKDMVILRRIDPIQSALGEMVRRELEVRATSKVKDKGSIS